MQSMKSWIEYLQNEFNIDIIKTQKETNDYVYDSTQYKSVMNYFYKKIDLLKIVSHDIDEDHILDEIWFGLPSDFRVHLAWSQVECLMITQFERVLNEKNSIYHELHIQCLKREECRD